jgi:hypothetical protein
MKHRKNYNGIKTYASEVARELSGIELRFAMGLATREDQLASLAV